MINVVWLKRDLRLNDHLPLFKAEQDEIDYIILFLFEPSLMSLSSTSFRHLQYCYSSISGINRSLSHNSRKVHLMHAVAVDAFSFITDNYAIKTVFSHQEHGAKTSWDRDKKMASFFKK